VVNSLFLPLASRASGGAYGAQPPHQAKPSPERPFLIGGLPMKVQIAPAVKSTATDSLFVWRLFDGGRQIAWGTAGNQEEAAAQAEAAHSERRGSGWGRSVTA
jgi:hypothetical protein